MRKKVVLYFASIC